MRLIKFTIVILSLLFAKNIFALTAIAKTNVAGDTCQVTAMDATMNSHRGVSFTLSGDDDDRIDYIVQN